MLQRGNVGIDVIVWRSAHIVVWERAREGAEAFDAMVGE